MGYTQTACSEILVDPRYKKLPKGTKSTFTAAAAAVKQLFDEAQPKLSEDMPETLSFGISEVNAAFLTAEAAVASVKSLMGRGALFGPSTR